ncbi:MAG TPA: NlpC/P60 family protein [Actinophytocola sp.]|uniref:C40 family peptidase n=1 Tax=Actinophytocola sp. TaxID=1872138 RepID=UPI002DDDA397|nr:NlpC/P60 family protein [Actinophytocola sp.]HEV2782935.1 NlpC/P60 family protein [Actinophytocola sp.]
MITAVSFSPVPALAQPPAQPPPPNNASEALAQYKEISEQAEKANEDLLAAKDALVARQADLDKATADLGVAQQAEQAAKAEEEKFRGTVDALASASFQGARFNKISALLTGSSQQEFLERASALSVLAQENREVLDKFTSAVDAAAAARNSALDAQRRSQEARDAAEKLVTDINNAAAELETRKEEARKAYDRLSGNDRKALVGEPDTGVYLAPPGVAGRAMEVALAQRGKPYVYGAEGPNSFDCSGLTSYAYAQAGLTIPRSSRQQYTIGKPVAYGEWQPGDLLFYGGSAGSIHHVAMYIGGGRIVHASTSGVPVKTDTVAGGGSDYFGAKRVAG